VNERLTGASETNKKINEACEEYRPVAHRATLIYFLIAEFSVVNCMYQTSLNQFNQLYETAIDNSEKATLPSKRINNIIEYMTYEIYLYIQRGLFERHKIIFALMLTSKVLSSAGKVKGEEIDIFLKGGGALDINSVRKKPKVCSATCFACIALSKDRAAACSDISTAADCFIMHVYVPCIVSADAHSAYTD
jgi:dynein heavy chain